jgi:hypothetical protein
MFALDIAYMLARLGESLLARLGESLSNVALFFLWSFGLILGSFS